MNVQALIWAIIAATGLVDVVLFAAQGMTITIKWPVVLFVAGLYAMSVLVGRRNAPAGRLVNAFAQIFAFGQVGGYLTYGAMAASPFPLADALLARMDAAIGFDWVAWFAWVHAHPMLHFLLAKAYASIPLQVLVLFVIFAYADVKRVDELVLATILSVAIIMPGMILLPAVGAWTQHGVGIVEPWRSEILALRSHALMAVGSTQGIITFPSFHAACGVLLANMARGRKWFLPVLVLNVAMIASVMSEGAHYGVDMLVGVMVAVVAIAASRALLAWCARMNGVMALPQLANQGGVVAMPTS